MRLVLSIGAVAAIGAIFLGFAGDGLAAYFTPDDMMNLYGAWFRPLAEQDRPLGALLYRGLFAAFGLNPLAYRLVCFTLLAANLIVLYAVSARLSGSREVGALACLLGAYHAHLADLYYNTGTLYDLLCFTFYWTAVWLWAGSEPHRDPEQSRDREGASPSFVMVPRTLPYGRGTVRRLLVLALYAFALCSKEMAVTLPLVLFLYDLAYRRGPSWREWTYREVIRLAPFALLTAGVVLLKTAGPIKMVGNPAYLPHLSWAALIEGWKHYGFDLFYGAVQLNTARVVLLWILLLTAAVLVRRRDSLVALGVIWAGLLPIIFIEPRGFYVTYLTLPGWYLLGARLLVDCTSRVRWRARPVALFAAVALALLPMHAAHKENGRSWVAEAHNSVKSVLEALRTEALPRAAKVLFVADPFPTDDYILLFIFRLRYRDDDFLVDRVKVRPALAQAYDRVYRLEAGKLIQVPR